MILVPNSWGSLREANDCHEPGGSPAGGQFCLKRGAAKASARTAPLLGKPVKIEPFTGGTCKTFLVRFENGAVAIWKPEQGEGWLDQDQKGPLRESITNREFSQAEREATAFDLSERLGLNLQPPTVVRTLEGHGQGSAQQFVEFGSHNVPPAWVAEDLFKGAVFDWLIGNTDRHWGNVMFARGKYQAIDNGLSFPTDLTELRSGIISKLIERRPVVPPAVVSKVRRALEKTDWSAWAAQTAMNAAEQRSFLKRVTMLKGALAQGGAAGFRQMAESFFAESERIHVSALRRQGQTVRAPR